MGKKTILNKLATLAFLGFISLNNLNAQENYHPKYHTIVHKVLQIEDSVKSSYPSLKTLDKLIDNSKKYIPKKESYTKEEIKKITKKIHENINKELPDISKRKDFCYRISLCFLAIGKENNIPFYASDMPSKPRGHMIIRYDLNKDNHDPINPDNPINKGDINIQVTKGEIQGEKYSDEYFKRIYRLTNKSLEKNNYLRNLNEKQLLSIPYFQRAGYFYRLNEFDKSIRESNKAINLDSKASENYEIKGVIFYLKEDYEKAIKIFNKSIELNSVSPELYGKRAMCHIKLENYEKSIQDYTKAIDLIDKWIGQEGFSRDLGFLDACKMRYLNNRHISYRKVGNIEEAEKDFEKLYQIIKLYKKD